MTAKKAERDKDFFCKKNREAPLLDIPVVYLPNTERVYHSPVINRTLLSRQEYTDFLATPKSFRWNDRTGLTEAKKWKVCKPKTCNENERLMVTDQRFMYDALSDLWNVATPGTIKRLKTILVQQFEFSPGDADRFLEEQKIRDIFRTYRPTGKVKLSRRHRWVKEFSKILSKKLSDYLLMMFDTRRTTRVRVMAETLLKRFGDITGEPCSLNDPQNGFESAEVILADRLAVWLSRVLESELDPEICREKLLKEMDEE